MIELRDLTKRYGATAAVDDLTATVEPGVVTGFLGPNGAGKSTTMRLVLGLDRPTAGTATIDGRRYRDLDHPLRTVGALLDPRQFQPHRTVAAHLRWIAASNASLCPASIPSISKVGSASAYPASCASFKITSKSRPVSRISVRI